MTDVLSILLKTNDSVGLNGVIHETIAPYSEVVWLELRFESKLFEVYSDSE